MLTGCSILSTLIQLIREVRHAIVKLGFGIATYTYGGLLGDFLLGRWFQNPDSKDAMIGFFVGLLSLLFMVEGPLQEYLPGEPLTVAWPLYTVVGSAIVVLVANLSWYLRRIFSKNS